MEAEPKLIARELAMARRQGIVTDPIPHAAVPDLPAAIALRAAAEEAMQERICGWKIGATNPEIQNLFGAQEPFCSALFAPRCHGNGDTVALPQGLMGFECEFAFRLAKDFRDLDQPKGEADVLDFVSEAYLAIEFVGTRQRTAGKLRLAQIVADFGLNVAFVLGPGVENWRSADLAGVAVRALVNGEPKAEGSGAQVLGHPLRALSWLIGNSERVLAPLRRGQIVSTGTCVGIVPCEPGDAIVGDFGIFGQVEACCR